MEYGPISVLAYRYDVFLAWRFFKGVNPVIAIVVTAFEPYLIHAFNYDQARPWTNIPHILSGISIEFPGQSFLGNAVPSLS